MITFSLYDLTEISFNKNSGADYLYTMVNDPGLNSWISQKLITDYTNDNLGILFAGVTSTDIIASVKNLFKILESETSSGTPFYSPISTQTSSNASPLYNFLRNLYGLLNNNTPATIRQNNNQLLANNTSYRANPFDFDTRSLVYQNTRKYLFTMPKEVEAALSLEASAALYDQNLITSIPISGNFTFDGSYLKNNQDKFKNQQYPTYTGVDMEVILMTPETIIKDITIKVLSYSLHSGLFPVSTLGRTNDKGYAKGDTVVAGTFISSITLEDPLINMQPILHQSETKYAPSNSDIWRQYLLHHQLPLFDILMVFTNEYGFKSSMVIFGVKITDTGSVVSMSDTEIECTFTFRAMDIEILRKLEDDSTSIMENNEYISLRNRIYKGESAHRSIFEVPVLYAAIDSRSKELELLRYKNNPNKNPMSDARKQALADILFGTDVSEI